MVPPCLSPNVSIESDKEFLLLSSQGNPGSRRFGVFTYSIRSGGLENEFRIRRKSSGIQGTIGVNFIF